jgi:guanidinoacetate N-methyltransferase
MFKSAVVLMLTRALADDSDKVCNATTGRCLTASEIIDNDRKDLGSPEFTEEMKKTWAQSDIEVNDTHLKIQGHPVMESWEHPYMKRLAEISSSQGGNVLELGFGMAISATYIEANKKQSRPLVSHHVIEANINQAARADKWAIEKAKSKVTIHRGYSWDVAPSLKDGFFDGILYDTYPLEKGKAGKHHRDFIEDAARLLKKGGVFTWFSNDAPKLSEDDYKLTTKAGFKCTEEQVPTPTPKDCQYWRHPYLIAPTCIKQ